MAPSGSEGSQCGERECPEDDLYSEEIALTEGSAADSKRRRHAEDGEEGALSFKGVKLDEGIWSALHDCILEKMIARLPFKSLFRAASLSKAWRLRFRSDLFQSEVQCSTAPSWNSYAPLYVNHKKDLVGYESSSERWHVLPNHSYLQQDIVEDWSLRAGAGSLLCWTSAAPFTFASPNNMCHNNIYHIHVTNPLTRSWRQLPPRPNMQFPDLVHMVCDGTENYKVMLATLRPKICVQIFDSASGTWTLDTHDTLTFDSEWGGIAFIDGAVYIIVLTMLRRSGYKLISFDVNENIWTEIPHLSKVADEDHQSPQEMMFYDVRFSELLVCGSNVMLVVAHRDRLSMMEFEFDDLSDDEQEAIRVLETISVFELDLDRGLAVEVSRAPNEMADVADVCSAAGHGDFIYIGGRLPSCASILYNVETQDWHWVTSARDRLKTSFGDTRMNQWLWTSIAYEPGVNPFLEV
ncbi:unnamed protein product [Calypogeia fissa]